MIAAVCRTEDGADEVVFDATPWFETADPEAIQNLVATWSGRWAARIAIALMDREPRLLELFRYVLKLSALFDAHVPFTCEVNGKQALAWLLRERNEWYCGLGLDELDQP